MARRIPSPLMLVAAAAVATALTAADSAPVQSFANMHSALRIKPGLWEFNDRVKVTGDTVLPDASVAGLSPAQRVRRLAEVRQMIAQPSRERECMSQASFERRLFGIDTSCKHIIASNSASRIEILFQCRGESGGLKQSKESRILAASPTAITMSFHAVNARNGKAMTVDSLETGHWVGLSCGNVHGIEQL
jgi:hypothetical protein